MVKFPRYSPLPPHKRSSSSEERANSLTHAMGALVALVGVGFLLWKAYKTGNPWILSGVGVYSSTLVLVFVTSTFYHGSSGAKIKGLMQIIDHVSIYLTIAGTYTPFILSHLKTRWGWTLFAVVWGLSIIGISYKVLFINRHPKLAGTSYILLGALSLVIVQDLVQAISVVGFLWLVGGGLAYIVGLSFLGWHKLPYNHAVWHFFVLMGSCCHYLAIYWYGI